MGINRAPIKFLTFGFLAPPNTVVYNEYIDSNKGDDDDNYDDDDLPLSYEALWNSVDMVLGPILRFHLKIR